MNFCVLSSKYLKLPKFKLAKKLREGADVVEVCKPKEQPGLLNLPYTRLN